MYQKKQEASNESLQTDWWNIAACLGPYFLTHFQNFSLLSLPTHTGDHRSFFGDMELLKRKLLQILTSWPCRGLLSEKPSLPTMHLSRLTSTELPLRSLWLILTCTASLNTWKIPERCQRERQRKKQGKRNSEGIKIKKRAKAHLKIV